MSKADLIEQAKALGIDGVTSRSKVVDLEKAIKNALKVEVLDREQAAKRLGITVDELMMSFHRGLPPGNLGFTESPGGRLVWRREDLLAPRKGR